MNMKEENNVWYMTGVDREEHKELGLLTGDIGSARKSKGGDDDESGSDYSGSDYGSDYDSDAEIDFPEIGHTLMGKNDSSSK